MSADYYEHLYCVFCYCVLGKVEARRCYDKKIRTVVRGGLRCAVCTACLEKGLYLERVLNAPQPVYQGSIEEPDPFIQKACIRCMYCGGILTRDEKDRHRYFEELYVIFRNQVLGRCYTCTRHGMCSAPYRANATG
ncbi:transforming protein [Odocoileus virginianus papillomavirus 1]|uniref:Protein E6 n=1 Tax=Odocoileus virginianus papillomavirus 1 TaxID=2772504 RepID=VE6_OVPVD|nr:transforming protein [Deltapapillomavirus 2]P03128.1 RecName: Full=Protein E6 [Odocoileus virginianus papillomavirus 1]AAA66841.1 transforming protein [Odocoileus virginianus papillomavirus 1]